MFLAGIGIITGFSKVGSCLFTIWFSFKNRMINFEFIAQVVAFFFPMKGERRLEKIRGWLIHFAVVELSSRQFDLPFYLTMYAYNITHLGSVAFFFGIFLVC